MNNELKPISSLAKYWAAEQANTESEAFEKALRGSKLSMKEPYTNKEQECSRCHHRLVCTMYFTHKSENYEGCDFFLPYLKPAIPLTTYDTETDYRNAWNEAVLAQHEINKSIKKAQAEYDTLEHNVSGLIDD